VALSSEKEYYVVYPKKRSAVSADEVDRIIVVAQNSLAEVGEMSDEHAIRLVFPDNFQAREFKQKLTNYFPNWAMRRLSKKS
ncbi:MAG: hypothetical protein QW688_06310, partial [Thermoprotei archaeon]